VEEVVADEEQVDMKLSDQSRWMKLTMMMSPAMTMIVLVVV
jgi:hypothetical protein